MLLEYVEVWTLIVSYHTFGYNLIIKSEINKNKRNFTFCEQLWQT